MPETTTAFAHVPMQWVGPVRISGNAAEDEVKIPLATYETTLFPSVKRGATVSRLVEGGIRATLVDERMTRSVLVTAPDAAEAAAAAQRICADVPRLQEVVRTTSRFATLIDVAPEIVGNLLYLRLEFTTGDAAGHNMVTLAADALMAHILQRESALQYGSISGNYCTDKKPSAVNGIRGRGKNVIAEILLPEEVLRRRLRTSAHTMHELNLRKNLVGSIAAGSLRAANAHYANMLLAFYLATGQDAANIVEGSQGITHTEVRGTDLYFSCTIPHLIVGTVGNGKGLDFVTENLERLGCREEREAGANARRLAALAAATVLCGELSLMAAQTNPGELMAAHVQFERSTR